MQFQPHYPFIPRVVALLLFPSVYAKTRASDTVNANPEVPIIDPVCPSRIHSNACRNAGDNAIGENVQEERERASM